MNQTSTALTAEQIKALDPARREAAELARGKPVEPSQATQEAVEPAPALSQPEPAPQPVAAAPATPAVLVTTFVNAAGRTKRVPLQWPIEHDGRVIDSVEICRLTGADFKRIARITPGEDETDVMLSLMTGLPVEVFGDIDADDFDNLVEAAEGFLPRKIRRAIRPTGDTGAASPQ